MTKEEAERIQEVCDEVILALTEKGRLKDRPNWAVNWGDVSCRDVLVSALHPNDFLILKIEEASPGAWGFGQAVAEEMEARTGLKFIVETEW